MTALSRLGSEAVDLCGIQAHWLAGMRDCTRGKVHLVDLAMPHQALVQSDFPLYLPCNCRHGTCSALHAELGGTHALLRLALPHQALLHADGLRLHSEKSIKEAAVWARAANGKQHQVGLQHRHQMLCLLAQPWGNDPFCKWGIPERRAAS